MDPAGKVALVTGGGTGIGRATALLLAQRGSDVAVNYSRSEAEADATVKEMLKLGRRAVRVRADVSRDEEAVAMVQTVVRELGRLDILVNSAGYTEFIDFKDLAKATPAVWERTMAVNVQGPFNCIRAAAAPMRQAGAGVVVNVSSLAGTLARGSSIPYCASKAALDIVTRSLARVLAPAIRVNGVAPGVVTTRWVEKHAAFVRGAQMQTPMRRVARPEDVAQVIVALIADGDFVTGQTVRVDGGLGA